MGDRIKIDFESTIDFKLPPHPDSIKRVVKHGVFLWWSDQTPSWVHPDDVEIVDRLVPGNRVFRREDCPNFADRELGYSRMRYGDIEFRALPLIWREVTHEGFELHDRVEIKSGFGKRRSRIATIRDIIWNRHYQKIEYYMSVNGQPVSRAFSVEEFQPAIRLGHHLSDRELNLAARARFA